MTERGGSLVEGTTSYVKHPELDRLAPMYNFMFQMILLDDEDGSVQIGSYSGGLLSVLESEINFYYGMIYDKSIL